VHFVIQLSSRNTVKECNHKKRSDSDSTRLVNEGGNLINSRTKAKTTRRIHRFIHAMHVSQPLSISRSCRQAKPTLMHYAMWRT
jgi:hypothetical protein